MLKPTQHYVLGYYQTSLRDSVKNVASLQWRLQISVAQTI
jgi:hypothetical protein